MRRFLIGALLLLHAMAHAQLGQWGSTAGEPWLVAPLWMLAMAGFTAAAVGAWGARPFHRWWRPIALGAAVASLLLVTAVFHYVFLPAMLADFIVIALLALGWRARTAASGAETAAAPSPRAPRRFARLARLGDGIATAFVSYVLAVTLLHPWYNNWGTTRADRADALPGDSLVRAPRYRIDHAVRIAAPPDRVWPCLVQLGQDRAGFYSYDWLERGVGAHVSNADRIVPEWQHRATGDVVRAVQPGFLGGAFGDTLGWKVTLVEPNRAIFLQHWGVFALTPMPDGTTRLYVRTRGEGTPTAASAIGGPIGLLVFEPAHFIMERGMLLGIKARAEQLAR